MTYKRYGKLMLIISCATHAILAAVASAGPTPDIDQLDGVLAELPRFDRGAAHGGRRRLRFGAQPPPAAGGSRHAFDDPAGTWPAAEGSQRTADGQIPPADEDAIQQEGYRKRPQVETVFSMLKRNLGSALRGRSHWSRCRDMLLRVITHNIMLIQ